MNNKYIELAIKEAQKAYKQGEVPVGAVIVKDNKVIAKAYNTIEKEKNSIKHAEIKVIEKASKKLKNWRLNDCELYVTLEPCEMCRGAIILSRIKKTYYILSRKDIKNNSNIEFEKVNNNENEYLNMLQDFFKEKRG